MNSIERICRACNTRSMYAYNNNDFGDYICPHCLYKRSKDFIKYIKENRLGVFIEQCEKNYSENLNKSMRYKFEMDLVVEEARCKYLKEFINKEYGENDEI